MASNFIAKGSDGYEAFMGRWSKRLARDFLDFTEIKDGERDHGGPEFISVKSMRVIARDALTAPK